MQSQHRMKMHEMETGGDTPPDYLFLQVNTPHINSLYTTMMINMIPT